MKYWIIAGVMLTAAAPAQAADCKNAMDQQSMNRCADLEYRAADARLNDIYGRLMATLGDDRLRTKLRLAQRAWIGFRDSECTFETADNEGGSIYPMVYAGCLARLTKERTHTLEQQTMCFRDAEKCGM